MRWRTKVICFVSLGLSASLLVDWPAAGEHRLAAGEPPADAAPAVSSSAADQSSRLQDDSRVEYLQAVGQAEGENHACAVASLGLLPPDVENSLRRRRLEAPLQHHVQSLYDLLATPDSGDEDRDLERLASIREESLVIDKYRAAIEAFNSRHYEVREAGAYLPDLPHTTYLRVFGVEALGRHELAVVIPISLENRADVARSLEQYEALRRQLLANESRVFNSLPEPERRRRVLLNDACQRQIDALDEALNAARKANRHEELSALVQQVDALRAQMIGMFFSVDHATMTISPRP